MFRKKGQIWVETVVYTLIGLTVIAIILSMALPQIEKSKDKALIEQTVTALNILDKKISEVEQAPGNSRVVELGISKGRLDIDADNNLIKYTLEDTKLELSEIGENITQGNIVLRTEKMPARFRIILTMNYPNLDITNKNGDGGIKTLQAGTTPYKIVMQNKETSSPGQNTNIEFSII
ncbi:MAG: hypothetical protein PHH54_04940 [Candidatus Nanoarchaeia archaeon]|nr:hypothetical protein [Candidatus Nanoarchaeia archaeon]MDD5741304.1 hypothetical protein [Candidatus Nanoarchaeia archaeon]